MPNLMALSWLVESEGGGSLAASLRHGVQRSQCRERTCSVRKPRGGEAPVWSCPCSLRLI
jgi:hypothetical protein